MTDHDRWIAEHDRRMAERKKRIEAARGPFERIRPYLGLDRGDVWGRRRGAPVARKLEDALRALREWRYANQQREHDNDEVNLSIRVVAEAMAVEIGEAAGPAQDRATIAWVVAGLRCPSRPFCTGCDSCFTIDAPHRHDVNFTTAEPRHV